MSRKVHRQILTRIAVVFAIALLTADESGQVFAHGAGGDIALFSTTTPSGEKVDVGFAILDDDDIHQIFFDPNDSVFNNILLPHTPTLLPPVPWTMGSAEPGFDANEGELAAVKLIHFNLLSLRYWDGSGVLDFGAAPGGLIAGYAPQPGLTGANGGHHSHPVFGIQGGGTPDGVYLAQVTVSIETMIDSNPYYKVSLVDRDLYTGDPDLDAENAEALGELVRAYVEDPMNNPEPVFMGKSYKYYADAISYAETLPVPEPGTLGLVALAVMGALSFRWQIRGGPR